MFKKIIKWIKRKTVNPYWIYDSGEVIVAEFEKYTPLIVSASRNIPRNLTTGYLLGNEILKDIKEDLRYSIFEKIKGEIRITEKDNVLIGKLFLFKPEEKQWNVHTVRRKVS